ncbi:ABC transporter permease [Actinomadura atramentaria]|uniref:ABC transporter permease n=1 Tax=Actinomadura atramentaria TaxID=1990 RepID=UPI0003676EF7|nr:ABC transporter permease [Actinomadura atramentaria]
MTAVLEKTAPERSTAGPVRRFATRLARQPLAVASAAVLVLLVLVAVAAPLLATHDPDATNLAARNLPAGGGHLFGTDDLGRDVYSRLLYGTRVTLLAPVIAVGVGAVLGVPAGLLAGYLGGPVDWLLSRVADALFALPGIVLAMAIVAVRGPSTANAMTAVGVLFAPRLFRVVRGATLSVRRAVFVDAARTIGAGTGRIVGHHVLPNVAAPIIVQFTVLLGFGVLMEAGLSFLGIGVQPPEASWGVLLRRGFDNLYAAPFQSVPPGVAITVLILAFQFLGDGMRDSLGKELRRDA